MTIKRVDAKVDFVKLEHEILDFWSRNSIFQKRVQKNAGKPKWSFLDGPITANNPMGVHHAWGRTLKDIIQRYKAMTGHELRYQNGFDCQGLWVEVEVEKELKFKTKRDIESYGIEKFVNLCKQRVLKYAGVQTEQSKRLGYWMDWDNSYFTMSEENNYTIWAFLKKLFEAGKIYRGTDVVPWSGRSGTSYSQMEIIEGRKLVAHDAVFVRFPLKHRENENLLVWTTTPWTLTSNVAAAVNRDMDYARIKAVDGSIFYLAKENLETPRLEKQFREKKNWVKGVPKLKSIAQIFKEHGGYEILGTVKGAEMIGWEYEGPYDHLEAQQIAGGYPYSDEALKAAGKTAISGHRVIDGGKDSMGQDIVVAGEGTGIVHIAPGCGDIDHKIGEREGLVNIAPLDGESKYIDKFGWLTGKSATDENTKTAIIKDLKERNLLIHVEKYPHVYPHCWRSGDELVFRIVEEWYINMDWRDRIKRVVDQIQWIPEWGQDREHEWLDNMGDWMISKKRFWGLALPIWTFEDGSFYVVGSRDELKELAVEGWDEFDGHTPHRPWIDKVKIRHPETGLVGTRVPDVGNPWLDAGIVPFSTMNYLTKPEYWKEWFPADFITECFPGQFRNWFYSLLAMSTFLEDRPPFKTLLGHALVKDETGRDMHKSWGNAIWFEDAAEKMGVDVMRWMYAGQHVEHNLLFGYGPANDVRKKLITLWNSYSFFATYASVDGFDPSAQPIPVKDRNLLDRWILAKLNVLVRDAKELYETYRFDKLMRKTERFIEDLSNWYIRRNRRRFWKSDNDEDKLAAYQTLHAVLLTTVKLLAPVLPFVTEKIYQNIGRNVADDEESIHLTDFPLANTGLIDKILIRQVDSLRKVVEGGRSVRNQAGLKIRQPLQLIRIYCPDADVRDFLETNAQVIEDELNLKAVDFTEDPGTLIGYQIKPNLARLGQQYGQALPEIRQELQSLDPKEVIRNIRKNGKFSLNSIRPKVELSEQDLIISTQSVEPFAAMELDDLVLGVHTELTEPLIREGQVRDLIRQVQIMRKNADFAVEDRIRVYARFPSKLQSAFDDYRDYFYAETLTKEWIDEFQPGDFHDTIRVGSESFKVGLARYQD
ncbi:MAG: isoleucine--tRNA ligase [FCB group bacterium]|nr:isoleucine--tRNA ligase [FCB group bacterium]